MKIFIYLGQWSLVWLSGQGLGRIKVWNIGSGAVCGRGMRMDIWEWTQTVKSFVLHANVHLKPSTMGEALSNQVDKMTQLTDESECH